MMISQPQDNPALGHGSLQDQGIWSASNPSLEGVSWETEQTRSVRTVKSPVHDLYRPEDSFPLPI